jgi:hypothetical protein
MGTLLQPIFPLSDLEHKESAKKGVLLIVIQEELDAEIIDENL